MNYPVLLATCDRLVGEREVFIRKAIGWTLRELADRDPETAEKAVLAIGPRASGLTLREATRKMDPDRRERIVRITTRANPVQDRRPRARN